MLVDGFRWVPCPLVPHLTDDAANSKASRFFLERVVGFPRGPDATDRQGRGTGSDSNAANAEFDCSEGRDGSPVRSLDRDHPRDVALLREGCPSDDTFADCDRAVEQGNRSRDTADYDVRGAPRE